MKIGLAFRFDWGDLSIKYKGVSAKIIDEEKEEYNITQHYRITKLLSRGSSHCVLYWRINLTDIPQFLPAAFEYNPFRASKLKNND